jgi:uncharacterized protein (TIGR03085 family)
MTGSSPSLADRERRALADLLAELGPDAPTLCAGWDTAHLAAHVVVRDSRPDALPGLGLESSAVGRPLTAWTHTLEDRRRTSTPYAELVAGVRAGPPAWMPFAWPGIGRAVNTAEFAIHHEDVRRAQPGWARRSLPPEAQDELWRNVVFSARRAAGGRRGGLVLRRSDRPGVEKRVGSGEPVTTVTGEPLELLLWSSGRRDAARVVITVA